MVRTICSMMALASLVTMMIAVRVPAAEAQTKATQADTAKPAIVNINTASLAELESLPGVGAKMAARILEYRQKNGPFKKVEELMNVRGLGEKNFLKLKDQLTVGAPKPADRAQQ